MMLLRSFTEKLLAEHFSHCPATNIVGERHMQNATCLTWGALFIVERVRSPRSEWDRSNGPVPALRDQI